MDRDTTREEIIGMPNSNILCELPTGYGKTKIAIDLMTARNIRSTNSILIVIPRLVLINTWKKELVKWGKGDFVKKVTFVTYVSLPKMAGKWDFVIFDECHHLSERCRESLESFSIRNSILLSATVKREMKAELMKTFENLGIYKIQIREATKEGILPDPEVFLIPLKLDNTSYSHEIIRNRTKGNPIVVHYRDKWKYIGEKNRKIIIKCTQKQYYDEMSGLIEWYRKKIKSEAFKQMFLRASGERLKWLSDCKMSVILEILGKLRKERTLTFCNSILQTEVYGKYCINSKNKYSERFLLMFNEGKINHITACNMIDEGVNLVNCRIGIYASLNSSERMITQKLGRILRHEKPVVIIPYYERTRDEEIMKRMCEDYNPELIKTVTLNDLNL